LNSLSLPGAGVLACRSCAIFTARSRKSATCRCGWVGEKQGVSG
jgi:hypothetical protein